MNDKYLKESIDILNRKFGEPLPTLEDTMKWHKEQKLKELKFGSKAQYDKYKKDHIIKPGTEIEIDGKKMKEPSSKKPAVDKKVDKKMSSAADDANARLAAAEKDAKKKKMNFQREGTLMENPVVAAAVTAAMQQQSVTNPKTKNKIKLSTAIKSKDKAVSEPAKKKAKSIIQRIKDKFKGKKKSEPKKQSKADADFYKRQFTGEVQEGPDDVRFARRALSKIAKHEASLRKAMFELEQAFLRDPRPENQKLAKDIKKNYKNNVTGFMKDSVQMIKRMK